MATISHTDGLTGTDGVPFQYDLVERTVLAGALVLVALFAAVVDDAALGVRVLCVANDPHL